MTYRQIQDATLKDAFGESKRADAKTWIQFRHAWLWDLEDWTFKHGTATITFTSGSQTAAGLPADFQAAVALYDSQGHWVQAVRDPREFFDSYNANVTLTIGKPRAYTIWAGSLFTDTLGDGATGLLVYDKAKPTLTNDADTTGLPDGYDVALVHGGKAEGFKLSNIPLWQGFDDDFTAAANALRRRYLTQIREQGEQFGAYRPDQWR